MTPVFREYMIHKAKMEQSVDTSNKKNTSIINDKVMRLGRTTNNGITNMTSAYNQVRNSGHTPTEAERDFLRFTSGSFVDKE